jgi:hypothetical protein
MNEDFNFVTVLRTGGEYTEKHVEWLQRQVGMPIICLTDSQKPMKDVETIPLKYDFPSWWCKMEMFRHDIGLKNYLYSDLDTVFLNGIPEQYRTLGKTVVLSDVSKKRPNREAKPIMNSGLMFLTGNEDPNIWRHFKVKSQEIMAQFQSKGDQGYIDTFLRNAARWQTMFPGEIKSYKSEVQNQVMSGKENIIVFHGKPRPWHSEVSHERWIPRVQND